MSGTSQTGAPRVAIAVIGLGGISQSVHLPLIRRNRDLVELTAVVDLSAARAAEFAREAGVGVQGFSSLDALLAARDAGDVRVDGAVLATSGSHAGDVGRLLDAGIRVLAEKPLAFSLGEIEELEASAARRGADLAAELRVGYMKEYDPATRAAADLLAGVELRAVTVEVLHPADGAQLAFARLAPPPTDIPGDVASELADRTAAIVERAIGAAPDPLPRLYTNVVLGSVIHDIALLRRLVGGIGTVERAQQWGGFPGSLSLGGRLAAYAEVPWSIDWHFIPDYPEYRETVTFHHATGTVSLRFAVPYVLNAPTVLTVAERVEPLGSRRSETEWMQEEAFEHELRSFAALVAGHPGVPGSASSAAEAADDLRVGQRMLRRLADSMGAPIAAESEAATDRESPPTHP
ncbi:Gfo/Idh/MocA family protein [Agromyces intestinalis]|nr:Gfo/Idh/MocA family oxidoreductase [Agromyces intestinalis]